MTENERWSRGRHRGRSDPRGSEDAFQRAKSALGPFTSTHQPELNFLCKCESCAERDILITAIEFNAKTLVIEGAPRKKTVANNLGNLGVSARRLADALAGLDDYSRDLLDKPHELSSNNWKLYELARGEDLPKPERGVEPAFDGVLVEQLKALGLYADGCREHFVAQNDADGSFAKGGNTNLLKQELGSPAWFLVRACWIFFQTFKPGEATATENGPFQAFVNDIHEYATGKIEENSTLHNLIKKMARLMRYQYELLDEYWSVRGELDPLYDGLTANASEERIYELELQAADLKEELERVFEILGQKQPL